MLVDITFANSRMGPRNRGGRPTLSQGLDREVSGLDLSHWGTVVQCDAVRCDANTLILGIGLPSRAQNYR